MLAVPAASTASQRMTWHWQIMWVVCVLHRSVDFR